MPYSVDEILKAYEILVKGIEADANNDEERAFGGYFEKRIIYID